MNYLGHLYLSGDNYPLMVANLFGDFVKGKNYTHLPGIVQRGVTLHRNIDDFTDTHPRVKELRLELYKELPKVAGIAIDLYFDHLLAKEWKDFSVIPLQKYVDSFFDYALSDTHLMFSAPNYDYPEKFVHLLKIMNENNWILRYQNIEGLNMAATGLSRRISFKNDLPRATKVFKKHEKYISITFKSFLHDAQQEFL